jgi:hypothetical protein
VPGVRSRSISALLSMPPSSLQSSTVATAALSSATRREYEPLDVLSLPFSTTQ